MLTDCDCTPDPSWDNGNPNRSTLPSQPRPGPATNFPSGRSLTGNANSVPFGLYGAEVASATSLQVVAMAPAMGIASQYQTMAHTNGVMFVNAISSQHQQNNLAQSVTSQVVDRIDKISTVADTIAITRRTRLG